MKEPAVSMANVVEAGIKRDVRVALENSCLRGALILIYAGIDAMASLGMPSDRSRATRADFISWCDAYMSFPGSEQLTGVDLYGARCGLLHTYSAYSEQSDTGRCRKLVYNDRPDPPFLFCSKTKPDIVIVPIRTLAQSFFAAIDRFTSDLAAVPARQALADDRLRKVLHVLQIPGVGDVSV